jgi:hypothetical protein
MGQTRMLLNLSINEVFDKIKKFEIRRWTSYLNFFAAVLISVSKKTQGVHKLSV